MTLRLRTQDEALNLLPKLTDYEMKIIVVQLGARHRYAVPRLLHQAGCLEALYTDSNGSYGAGSLLGGLPPSLLPQPALRLRQRRILGLPAAAVRCTDMLMPLDSLLRRFSRSEFDFYRRRDRIFSHALARWGFGQATMIYSMFGEGWSFIEAAKRRGLKIALDMFVNPITHRIVEKERQAFPEWEAPENASFDVLERDVDTRIALADLLLCPAEAVADGMRCYPSFAEEKIRVVPYGFAGDAQPRGFKPVRRRILFGGAATLRKGIHYFARAAELLSRDAPSYEFRVAGPATQIVRGRPECRFLKFLGPLTRADFLAEMEAADVFVLPTLAEGSATVIYESLALGVPVVTTRSAGSVITNGKEGRIIPERDSTALADAIAEITADRELRDAMSIAAICTAGEFSEAKWGERLISALQSVPQPIYENGIRSTYE